MRIGENVGMAGALPYSIKFLCEAVGSMGRRAFNTVLRITLSNSQSRTGVAVRRKQQFQSSLFSFPASRELQLGRCAVALCHELPSNARLPVFFGMTSMGGQK